MQEMLVEWPANRHLHLVRHAEARKNVEDRQGGQGTELTIRGIDQARRIAVRLNDYETSVGHKLVVLGHSAPQVQETMTAISSAHRWPCAMDDNLRGIHLGSIDGLPADEAQRLDPVAVDRLEAWRQGRLRVDQVRLPGGEDFKEFRRRVAKALARSLYDYQGMCAVFVGTRSTLILLHNILTLGKGFDYSRYVPYSFPNGFVSRWELSEGLARNDDQFAVPVAEPVPVGTVPSLRNPGS